LVSKIGTEGSIIKGGGTRRERANSVDKTRTIGKTQPRKIQKDLTDSWHTEEEKKR